MSSFRPRIAAVTACLVLLSAFAAACTEPSQSRRPAASPNSSVRSERSDRDR
jgi:hypothetical protein